VIVVGWRCRWLIWLIKSRSFVNFYKNRAKVVKFLRICKFLFLEFYLFEIFVDYV
jgi:hypothetical protein